MAEKEIATLIKLQIPAGKATPAPHKPLKSSPISCG